MYSQPYYTDSFNTMYPLRDIKNFDVKFYQLTYLIDTNFLSLKTSNWTYPAMERIVASNGLEIMRTKFDFDYGSYRLLQEDVEEVEGLQGVSKVVETYGYTPNVSIKTPVQIAWQRPGFEDTSAGGVTTTASAVANNLTSQIHTITVANSSNTLKVGDLITISSPYYSTGGTWYLRQMSEPVVILTATTTQITVGAFTFTQYYNNGAIAGTNSSFDTSQSCMYFSARIKNITTYASKRSSFAADFSGYKETTFLTKNPMDFSNSVEPFSITKAGEIVDTLDASTVPTVSDYKAQIAAKNFLIAQPQQVNQLMGDVYMQDTFYLPYQ